MLVFAVFLLLGCSAVLRAADADKAATEAAGRAGSATRWSYTVRGSTTRRYHAYEDLAKKDPKADSLPFNAGASAYMGRQYDEAMDAFGKALTSADPALAREVALQFRQHAFPARRGPEGAARRRSPTGSNAHPALRQHAGRRSSMPTPPAGTKPWRANTAYNRAGGAEAPGRRTQGAAQATGPQKDQDKKEQTRTRTRRTRRTNPRSGQKGQDRIRRTSPSRIRQEQAGPAAKTGRQERSQQSPDQKGSSSSPDQNGEGNQPPKPDDQSAEG